MVCTDVVWSEVGVELVSVVVSDGVCDVTVLWAVVCDHAGVSV